MKDEKDQAQVVYAMLPLVSVLPETRQVREATEMLEELDALQQLIEAHSTRQDEIKIKLAGLQKLAGTQGLRSGELCFVERLMPGRETMDKAKLMIETGVTAAQIKACSKVGKPYEQRTFKNLGKPGRSDKHGGERGEE